MKRKKDQPPIILRLKRLRTDDDIKTTSAPPIRLRLKRVKNQGNIQTTSRLLKLPPDLRSAIWELLVNDATSGPIDLRHFRSPAVTQVCRQTRQETSSMIVPALQNKEWEVPLLICDECKPQHEFTIESHHTTMCEHLGGNLLEWAVAPWLKKLASLSDWTVTTKQVVRFYPDYIRSCRIQYRRRAVQICRYPYAARTAIEDRRLDMLNAYAQRTDRGTALDLDKVLSLASVFYEPYFCERPSNERALTLGRTSNIRQQVVNLPDWAREETRPDCQ